MECNKCRKEIEAAHYSFAFQYENPETGHKTDPISGVLCTVCALKSLAFVTGQEVPDIEELIK